jgi:hypothetical protein
MCRRSGTSRLVAGIFGVGLLVLAIAVTPANAANKQKKHQNTARKHQQGAAAAPTAGQAIIAGSVKNRAGHGVAGALVRVQHLVPHRNRAQGSSRHVRTNHAGDFTIRAPLGRYAITASKRGVGSQRAFLTPSPGSATRLTIIITPHHGHHYGHHHHAHHAIVRHVPTPPGSVGTSTKH